MSSEAIVQNYLDDSRSAMRAYKKLAEKAIAQLKDEVIAYWERGWKCVFDALAPLRPEDCEKTVLIRGEKHTIVQAINRQLMHYAYHIGQIVYLAKHFRSAQWNSLSIPRNRSAEFTAYVSAQPGEVDREKHFDAAAGFQSSEKR